MHIEFDELVEQLKYSVSREEYFDVLRAAATMYWEEGHAAALAEARQDLKVAISYRDLQRLVGISVRVLRKFGETDEGSNEQYYLSQLLGKRK